MKIKITLTLFSAAILLLLSACSIKQSSMETLDEKKEYEIKQKATKAIDKIAGAMQMKLYEKTKEGGISHAASFCSTNAALLSKKSASILPVGVSLKRITDKPRNKGNQASEEELIILKKIEEKIKNNEKFDMLIAQKSSNHFQVYKPIKMMGVCLKCHGTAQTRDEKAYKVIEKNYPDDKAINYKLYDLRGAFLVDIIEK